MSCYDVNQKQERGGGVLSADGYTCEVRLVPPHGVRLTWTAPGNVHTVLLPDGIPKVSNG